MIGGAEVSTAFIILAVVLFIFVFNAQICDLIDNTKSSVLSMLGSNEHVTGLTLDQGVSANLRGITEHATNRVNVERAFGGITEHATNRVNVGKSFSGITENMGGVNVARSLGGITEYWQPTRNAPGYRGNNAVVHGPIRNENWQPTHNAPGYREHLTDADPDSLGLPPGQTSDVLTVLGHTGQQPWTEIMKATELDPSVFVNHTEFVKDVRRFSSGANFTSVNDDNTNSDFTNFIGLRRPTHVPIGSTARQQPDVDQSVLMRNKRYSWNADGPNFAKEYYGKV